MADEVGWERGDRAHGTLVGLLAWAADTYGDHPAIEDGSRTITFAELPGQASRVGRGLIALGVGHGDRVAIWAPNIWEWVVAALGIQAVGGVLVPINTRYKGGEARALLSRSGCRVLMTVQGFLDTDYLDLLDKVGGVPDGIEAIVLLRGKGPEGTLDLGELLRGGEAVPGATAEKRASAVAPDDLSDILYTSGTTGHPKGVMTTHAQSLRVFRDWTGIVGLTHGDRYLVVAPFFHCFGYKAGWLACLMAGATILPQSVFDAGAVLARIAPERVTVLPGPPALYQTLLGRDDLGDHDLSSLRLAVTGAAAIPVELIEDMKSRLGFDTVITGYGLTESTGVATMCRFDDDPETIATTSGRAIPDVEVQVVDDDGIELPRGEPGEVVVRGYNVMLGYLDDPGATAEAIDSAGWLHTGDIGVMDSQGYLRITDRKKDMFIMGGFNCYPAEIENLMLAHPDLVQVAVIGIPDARMGEVGMAFAVLRGGARLSGDDLLGWCQAKMANFKVPRRVEIVDALPTNAVGKVQKFVLRRQATP